VLGAGITGLTTAWTLRRASPRLHVVLIEASDRLGGKLWTRHHDGLQVEAGADSFLAREPEALELCRALNIDDELIRPAVFGGLTWVDGGLRPFPQPSVMGIPAAPSALLSAQALTPAGKARALADLVLPRTRIGTDTSVGAYVRARMGAEVLERLVDPVLGGTRAGDPDTMSLAAAVPAVDSVARSSRSLLLGLRRSRAVASDDGPLFLAPRSGMTRLIDALHRAADADTRTGVRVRQVLRADERYVVRSTAGDIEADHVVLALPSHEAARVLGGGAAASRLAEIQHASVAVTTFVLPPNAMTPPRGSSGYLVPQREQNVVSAATWWSEKWPHTASADGIVIRCFVGRSGRHPALALTDDELLAATFRDLVAAVPATAQPRSGWVTRWDDALPQYEVGHAERVEAIEDALAAGYPRVHLAGAAYRGSGIAACIRSGTRAADTILASLRDRDV